MTERRTFFVPTRDPWNHHIYQMLKYVDKLQEFYLSTGDPFYEEQSKTIRKSVEELKTKIHSLENFNN
jgi:hypothetical protein